MNQKQRRWQSHLEISIDLLIGMLVSMMCTLFIIGPVYGIDHNTAGTAFEITMFYTMLSYIRRYITRRWFESFINEFTARLALIIENWRTNQ